MTAAEVTTISPTLPQYSHVPLRVLPADSFTGVFVGRRSALVAVVRGSRATTHRWRTRDGGTLTRCVLSLPDTALDTKVPLPLRPSMPERR